MKVIITDLKSGEERVTNHCAPSENMEGRRDILAEFVYVDGLRELVIDNIIGNIYNFTFPHIYDENARKHGWRMQNETFILSPHSDMVRERTLTHISNNYEVSEDTPFVTYTYHVVSPSEMTRRTVEDTEE